MVGYANIKEIKFWNVAQSGWASEIRGVNGVPAAYCEMTKMCPFINVDD